MAFTATENINQEPLDPEDPYTIKEAWSTTQAHYAIHSTQKLAQITLNKEVKNYNEAARNFTKNGTYKSSPKTPINYLNWNKEIKKQPNQIQDTELTNLNITTDKLKIQTESKLKVQLPKRNKTLQVSNTKNAKGVKDPILEGIEDREIQACSFKQLAVKLFTGSDNNGTARGKPVINPEPDLSGVSNKEEKILLADNVRDYQKNRVEQFAGYATKNSESGYNNVYVTDISSTPKFEPGQRALIHEGLWKSNFFKTRNKQCYLPTNLKQAPGISERIETKTRGNRDGGIFTILSDSATGESEIGYERANNSNLNLVKIKGVSEGKGKIWNNYLMNKSIAEEQNLSQLIK
jgi:hypothetical protein